MHRKVHFELKQKVRMNNLRERYFSIEQSLFPMVEKELGELTAKMEDFISSPYEFRVCRTESRSFLS